MPDAASYMAYMGIEAPPSTNYPLSQIVRTTPQPNQPNTTFIGLDNAGSVLCHREIYRYIWQY